MTMNVKRKLKELEGQLFFTVTGIPYTFRFIEENIVRTDRANRNIPVSDFEKYPCVDLNYMEKKDDKKEIKRESAIDKFNRRFRL